MNKKIIVPVGILLLIILAVGVFMMMKKPGIQTSGGQQANTVTQNNPVGEEKGVAGTLKDLLTGGQAQKCTYSNENDAAKTVGTVYASGGKMRLDIQSNVSDKTINSHVIVDSQYSYVWTDQQKQGFKMAITKETPNPGQKKESVDLNQPVNYKCQSWNTDNSFFNLPSDITFTTFTVPSPAANGSGNQCALCDNVPEGEARDTCRTQLKCQ
jgi:hypothetical protein